jgi:hypothetical protein
VAVRDQAGAEPHRVDDGCRVRQRDTAGAGRRRRMDCDRPHAPAAPDAGRAGRDAGKCYGHRHPAPRHPLADLTGRSGHCPPDADAHRRAHADTHQLPFPDCTRHRHVYANARAAHSHCNSRTNCHGYSHGHANRTSARPRRADRRSDGRGELLVALLENPDAAREPLQVYFCGENAWRKVSTFLARTTARADRPVSADYAITDAQPAIQDLDERWVLEQVETWTYTSAGGQQTGSRDSYLYYLVATADAARPFCIDDYSSQAIP